MPASTFQEKIKTIIKTNPYGIDSVTQLEVYCGISRSTLARAYKADKQPPTKHIKRLIEALCIPRAWWDNPVGEPFTTLNQEVEFLRQEMLKLQAENTQLKERLSIVEQKVLFI